MDSRLLNDLFKLFLADLIYIQSFVFENFGKNKILENKNQGKFLSRDYSIKNSRIKGYAFHGYGCLFQFRDFYIDVDLRFDKVGFTIECLSKYLQQKSSEIEIGEIEKFLKTEIELKIIEFNKEEVYMLIQGTAAKGVLKPLGLGSTGRTTAANLTEQLAMKEIMSNPSAGQVIPKMKPLTDPRWSGWNKMQYIHTGLDGSKTVIHYNGKWVNGVLKAVDDFKFKQL